MTEWKPIAEYDRDKQTAAAECRTVFWIPPMKDRLGLVWPHQTFGSAVYAFQGEATYFAILEPPQ